MNRFNTGNPINSLAEEDFYDNCLSLDQAMNSTEPTWRDRFNVEKPTIDAALKSAGFMPAGFDFVTGGTLQPGDRNKAVYNPAPNGDNNWYRWNGAFPKEIAPNSQPNPKDENNWVPVLIKIDVVAREALRRSYAEAGLTLVPGSFEFGGTVSKVNDVLLYETEGKVYSWNGILPKEVPAKSTPVSRGGSGSGSWFDQSRTTREHSPRDFGAIGDGVVDDTSAVLKAQGTLNEAQKIDGEGDVFKVSTLPNMSSFSATKFVNERIPGQPLSYVTDDYIKGSLTKVTDTPFYNAWPQDKAFVYDDVIYAPFMAGERHGVGNLHVAWTRSGDDGQTWTMPEWVTDLHPDYPSVNYHCMSMGVVRNRLFAMIETRTVAANSLTNCALWDRPMSRSGHPVGGITKARNQSTAQIVISDHGLFVGDFINFSNSGVTGVSGDMVVSGVVDRNTFQVVTPNQQTSDQNNSGISWHYGTSFHKSPWRKTELGLIPMVTEVHSFATIDSNSFSMGYHQGDISPREVGTLYFADPFNDPASYVKRRIPAAYEPDAAEPCVKVYDGVMYLITRGTLSSKPGSSLHRSNDLGVTWESLRFPNNVHHSNLPFAKVGNELIVFGTERADNEWEATAPDVRYVTSYPRTFYARVNLDTWDISQTEWICITNQIYQGDIVNSGVGVGSVVVKGEYIYYLFGGEDHFNPNTYGDNSAKDPFVRDGHPSDLYCWKMLVGSDNRVSRNFKYGAVPNRSIPTFMDTDGKRIIPASLKLTGNNTHGNVSLGDVTIRASTIRSEVQFEGEYGFIGKTIPNANSASQRLIICGGEGTSFATGAQITLYGNSHITPKRATYNAVDHFFQTGDIKPYNDNNNSLGGPSQRFTTLYLTSNPIVTSDAAAKTDVERIPVQVLRAWGKVKYQQYRDKSAVELKGDNARIHVGVIAQQVKDAFESEGLDPFKYGLLCRDEWEAVVEPITDIRTVHEEDPETGEILEYTEEYYTGEIKTIVPAGSRYGVRYDEALALECAYLRARLDGTL